MQYKKTIRYISIIMLFLLLLVVIFTFTSMATEISEEYNITDIERHEHTVEPRIAADSDGNFHILYLFNDGNGWNQLIHQKVDSTGLSMSGPTRISPTDVDNNFVEIALAVDSSNRIHVAFITKTSNDAIFNVYYSKLTSEGSIRVRATNIVPSDIQADSVDIDVDSQGHAYIVFSELTDPPTIKWTKVSVNGIVIEQPMKVSGDRILTGNNFNPRIMVNPSGTSYIMWLERFNQFARTSIHYTQISSSGNVNVDPNEIISHVVYDLTELECDINSDGDLLLTYEQDGEIFIASVNHDGSVLSTEEVTQTIWGEARSPDISVSPNDDIYIIYRERENTLTDQWLPIVRIWDNDDETWQNAIRVYDGSDSIIFLRVAAASSNAAVTYRRDGNIMMVTVLKELLNQPPIPSISHSPQNPSIDEAVTFDGSESTDPDDGDTVEEFLFDFGDGSNSGWVMTPSVTHKYSAAGTFTTSLRVIDNHGLECTSSDTMRVTVTTASSNQVPTAVLSVDNNSPERGQEVYFDGTNSFDIDGVISHYLFDFDDGIISGWVSTPKVKHTYINEGEYITTLKVRDDMGAESELDFVSVSVLVTNELPTAIIVSIVPNPAFVEDQITFEGLGIDTDGTIDGYRWESDIDGVLGSSAAITTILQEGIHSIMFKVKDDDDAWSQGVTQTVTVKENMVFILSDETQIPERIYTDTIIKFRVIYTDEDNDPPTVSNLIYSKGKDRKSIKMSAMIPSDSNYSDGKEYFVELKLSLGDWKYNFEFKNQYNDLRETDEKVLHVQAKQSIPQFVLGAQILFFSSILVGIGFYIFSKKKDR